MPLTLTSVLSLRERKAGFPRNLFRQTKLPLLRITVDHREVFAPERQVPSIRREKVRMRAAAQRGM